LRQAELGSVKECLEALPIEYREAFVLRELEEMSYKEIADVAGVPIGTVMSRLSRARKRLQTCLRLKEGPQ
jgi:RNA polymerase sigma-70 factor (ECF subfamily)